MAQICSFISSLITATPVELKQECLDLGAFCFEPLTAQHLTVGRIHLLLKEVEQIPAILYDWLLSLTIHIVTGHTMRGWH
jgi:hypothetical protein